MISKSQNYKQKNREHVLQRSAALILQAAVKKLHPEVKLIQYGSNADEFFYEFSVSKPLNPEELLRIEQEIQSLVAKNYEFDYFMVMPEEARLLFSKEPFKLDEIDRYSRALPLCKYGDWYDLGKGPYLLKGKEIQNIKIIRSSLPINYSREEFGFHQRIYAHVK